MNCIKTHLPTHVGYLVIIGVVLFAGRLWLREHDARLRADVQVKAAQATIDGLEKQQSAVAETAKSQVIVLQKEAADVKTPAQAVKAITAPAPDLNAETAPMDAEVLPDAPERVSVNALPLFRALNSCKQDAVNLQACTGELDIQKRITAQKDVQIVALKKRPGFFHRLGKAAKVIGCAAAGAAAGSLSKSASGAAIGAAAGAGICQLF